MKRPILTVILFLGCFFSKIYAQSEAKKTIQKLMKHIMLREKSAFMRFDQAAFHIMQQHNPTADQMSSLYTTEYAPNIYKSACQSSDYAPYPYNPLVLMAQEDLNYCTRFLKLVKKYTSLIITDRSLPEELTNLLFKSGSMHIMLADANTETLDHITHRCDQILHGIDEFTIVVTNLNGISPLLQHALMAKRNNIILIDMTDLIHVLLDSEQTYIDYQRFCRLMRRNIIVMSTAAIISGTEIYRDFERRKAQYIKSIEVFHEIGYEPFIIETCTTGPTFLDDYCHQVLYTHSNDSSQINKGVNEGKSILIFLETYKNMINEDDIIIKTTGRYHLAHDSFIRLVEDNDRYAGFIKHRLPDMRQYIDLFTGLFALEARYLSNMLASIRYELMDANIWFEWDVARYFHTLTERHVPIMYLDSVGMYHYEGENDAEKLG
jgi:hypothetical protein